MDVDVYDGCGWMWMGMMGVDGHACGGCESVDVTVSLCSFPQLFHSVMWMGMVGVDGHARGGY